MLINAHPSVAESAVVGYPDPVLGEKLCACVALRQEQTLDLDTLVAYLQDEAKVAAFKLPERLIFVDALPRNPVGKILKRRLREQAKAVGVTQ